MVDTAKECSAPAAIAFIFSFFNAPTSRGVSADSMSDPRPSSPCLFLPHDHTCPLSVRQRVWKLPAATAIAGSGSGTSSGTNTSA